MRLHIDADSDFRLLASMREHIAGVRTLNTGARDLISLTRAAIAAADRDMVESALSAHERAAKWLAQNLLAAD